METLNEWISVVNDILWSYVLIILLLGCAVWFTLRGHFAQFRMIGEMVRLLGDSNNKAGQPGDGRFQQQSGAAGRGQAHLLLPGLRGLIGEPCRHGQPGGRGDRRGHRRAGRRVLDVADRPAGLVERVCRVDAGPTL